MVIFQPRQFLKGINRITRTVNGGADKNERAVFIALPGNIKSTAIPLVSELDIFSPVNIYRKTLSWEPGILPVTGIIFCQPAFIDALIIPFLNSTIITGELNYASII